MAGGQQPSYTSAGWNENWAAVGADSDFDLTEVMGQEAMDAAWAEMVECIESRETNFIVGRDDLGYTVAE